MSEELSPEKTEKLAAFTEIVRADDVGKARKFLEACSWNNEEAVNLWFEHGGDASKLPKPKTPSPPPSK